MAVLVAVVYRSPVERGVSTWLVSRLDSRCGCLAFLCTPSTALFLLQRVRGGCEAVNILALTGGPARGCAPRGRIY